MVCCISFGAINIKILIPIFGGICKLIMNLFADKSKIVKHPLMLSICSSLGMTLSFIPFIITIKRSKTKKQTNKEKLLLLQLKQKVTKSLTIDYEYNNEYQESNCDKFKYLLLASFLDFSQTLLTFFVIQSIDLNLWIIDIILISILSFFIFGVKLYRHQKFSIIIIVILVLLLDLHVNNFFMTGRVDFLSLFIRIIGEVFFSTSLVLHKYLIEKKFLSPYEICFFVGIITLIFYSICIIISSNISNENLNVEYCEKKYFDHFFSYINDIKMTEIILFISFMFIQFFFNISILLTIRYFSPTHTLIVLVIGRTSPCIQKIINTKGDTRQIIFFLISLVIFFFLLVFNEVIELNCFKLQRNTIKNMQIRAINESIQEMDNKSNESSSWTSGNNNKSYDLGISSKNLNINENEEIEENDLINIRQNSFIYDSSM